MQNKEEKQKEKINPVIECSENPASSITVSCFEWIEAIAQTMAVTIAVLVFVFMFVDVDGPSMLNTLHSGDKVGIVKWYYTPKNSDVVVISKGQNIDKPLIKRVIATEGQSLRIDFSTGEVFVNDKLLDEPYIKDPTKFREDGDIPAVIPEGYTFVMGDNRNNSLDSRSKSVGLIDNRDIVGKASFIIFPFNRIRIIK